MFSKTFFLRVIGDCGKGLTTQVKAITGDKSSVDQILEFVFERFENFLGKGENAGYHHFLLFPKLF